MLGIVMKWLEEKKVRKNRWVIKVNICTIKGIFKRAIANIICKIIAAAICLKLMADLFWEKGMAINTKPIKPMIICKIKEMFMA